MAIFSSERREEVRSHLLDAAEKDPRIVAAALTGSGARGEEDRWSDLDLAFGVKDDELTKVLEDWTDLMRRDFDAMHLVDVVSRTSIYRVFLLAGSLQVDLAFCPETDFRATGASFRLLFGESQEPVSMPTQSVRQLIGMGTLYVLHAHTAIERGKLWQAEFFIRGLRDYALGLACRRLGLEASYGRGYDDLPKSFLAKLEGSFTSSPSRAGLSEALSEITELFLEEAQSADAEFVDELERVSVRERTRKRSPFNR